MAVSVARNAIHEERAGHASDGAGGSQASLPRLVATDAATDGNAGWSFDWSRSDVDDAADGVVAVEGARGPTHDLDALDLVELDELILEYNRIEVIRPLINNPGIGDGDRVYIYGNDLDCDDPLTLQILMELETSGVYMDHDCD